MTFRTLIRRSLRFHWRSHLGVVLGAAIGSAALIGALVVGDSVKGSLRQHATERLGKVALALAPGDRFFKEDLWERFPGGMRDAWREEGLFTYFPAHPAAVLQLPGVATTQSGSARANQVTVIGAVEDAERRPQNFYEDFWSFRARGAAPVIKPGEVWLNPALAGQLGATLGQDIILRVRKSGLLASETPLAPQTDNTPALRLRFAGIVAPEQLGNFSLRSRATPPLNAFVHLRDLQTATGLEGRANLLLGWAVAQSPDGLVDKVPPSIYRYLPARLSHWLNGNNRAKTGTDSAANADAELAERLTLGDLQATLKLTPDAAHLALTSPRVFLDPAMIRAALIDSTNEIYVPLGADEFPRVAQPPPNTANAQPILTYLATLLRAGTNATPYSMVTAVGSPWTPADLRDDEIVLSQWLAEDLHVKPGDAIALSYFLPESGVNLTEATNTFRVHSIVPMEMPWADRTLMPDFPGIEKAESTSEWDAGFPLTYEIRKQDDEYWKQYRGTPKAFITLAAGQKLWGNRFGNLTAIQFPIPPHSPATNYQAALEKKILANLKPAELGFRFEPGREQALQAAEQSQDFGGLFLGFSFFVIGAALLLMALLFQFGLEQRAPEIGTLLALGFTPKQVRNLFLREGLVLAALGGGIGALGGIYFAKAMLLGLTTVWRDAVGATALQFHITAATLIIGIIASTVVSAGTIWLALRKFVKRPPRELLAGDTQSETVQAQSPKSKIIAVTALLLALGLVGWAWARGDTANAGAFFGAGALGLIAGLSLVNVWLARLSSAKQRADKSDGATFSTLALAVRGCARRRKRSLATVAMLACGSFLIVSIGVFRLDAQREATEKSSGTGGFALLGETTLPVVQDLNTPAGRDFFALNARGLAGVNFVPFRVRAGDEASCLNLNAAQKPRLLGVKPELLWDRFGFSKRLNEMTKSSEWFDLNRGALSFQLESNEIPAIGDANSIQWAMHKKVGDTIDYVDERGEPFKVRIVGAVANSILQGQLIIDEAEFVKRFPGETGYRMFLIDAPSNSVTQVSTTLSRALQDVGLELTPTVVRLNQFNAVQNTYLGTFQVLGGLGLLLGSVGLGIVVLRNVLERRSELAVLLAVGFRRRQVQGLLLVENGALLLLGLALGTLTAGIAVLPAVLTPTMQLPVGSLGVTLAGVLLNGILWTALATRYAVRGDLLAALRND